MGFILDLIVLAIIVLCIVISAKKGFVKVLIETAGFIIAIILAFTISSPLANYTYDNLIEPAIVKSAANEVGDKAEKEAADALPGFVSNDDSTANKFTEKINQNMHKGTETAVRESSREVIKPIATKILGLLFSIILVTILSVVLKLAAGFLNSLFSFSVVGKLNSILGGILGSLRGVVFAIIFCMVISLIISYLGKPFLIFSEENINNSFLFKLLTEIVPF